MKTAFAYMRVSGRGQIEGDGFPRQEKEIRDYAQAHGIRIRRWFREMGVSGAKDLENRPALQELMIALHGNGVKAVIVEKLDRLARDLMVQESIIADFQRHGFELVSTTEPDLCSGDPTRTLLRQMMGAFSQYEKAMIVTKLRAARQRTRAKTGRCEGAKPYGELPGEAEVVTVMRELRTEGMGFGRIARTLDERGLHPRAGGHWHSANVSRILARVPL